MKISNMNEAEKRPSSIRRVEDARNVGTTENAKAVKRNNYSQPMPTMRDRMTRGDAGNVVKRKVSPTNRIGAGDKTEFGCADLGCTATTCIPGMPLKNI